MSGPICLWDPKPDVASDDAGVTVLKYSFPDRKVPPPYEPANSSKLDEPILYVRSLQSLCIKKLVDFPEQVHSLGPTRLLYEPPTSRGDRDILRELIPNFSHSQEAEDDFSPDTFLTTVDPRLWAVLVQVYTGLPEAFRTYTLPLSDAHLPLLQQIPSTSHFALVTVVELQGCPDLNDHTIVRLRDLHGLGALDITRTKVTSWGIKCLARTLRTNESHSNSNPAHLEGPWRLRVLSLRECKNVNDDVFQALNKFPLLCVVDLRKTHCTHNSYLGSAFLPSKNGSLFYPTPFLDILEELGSSTTAGDGSHHSAPRVFPHSPPTRIHVASQYYRSDAEQWKQRDRQQVSAIFLSFMQAKRDRDALGTRIHAGSVEARRHASSAAALAFYAPLPTYAADPKVSAAHHLSLASTSNEDFTQSLLQLYRVPPPWEILLNVTNSVDHESKQHKRVRMADETEQLAAPKRNEGAVQSLLQRGNTIKICSEFEKDREERRKTALTSNPFARTMPISVFEEERLKALAAPSASAAAVASPSSASMIPARTPKTTSPNSRSTSRGKQKVSPHTDGLDPESLQRPSTLPIPSRSTRPLYPISTLPIPQLPREVLAKTKPPSSKHPPLAHSKSHAANQPTKQTKLSDFINSKSTMSSGRRGSFTVETREDGPGRAARSDPKDRKSTTSLAHEQKGQTGSSTGGGVTMQQRRKSSGTPNCNRKGSNGS